MNKILGTLAIALIALPVGVFAQTDETPQVQEDQATTTEEVAETVAPETTKYQDNYKREKLPPSNKEFNDFVVGPGSINLEVAPGESKTVMLTVSNRLGSDRRFRFVTEDMTDDPADTSGAVKLLGDQVGPYTIKDYITVPSDHIIIKDQERAIIPVTVSIPANADPGGFYGSILTEALPVAKRPGDDVLEPAAALVTRIGTLFFVKTPGEVNEEGSVIDFTTIPDQKFFLSGPIKMGIVFENTGSVHLLPEGEVTITNIMGESVGDVVLEPWTVFPQSIRTKDMTWTREFLFGRYTVEAKINRGYDDEVDEVSLVFWVLPWKILAVVFVVLFLFILTLRFFARNFEFKRK